MSIYKPSLLDKFKDFVNGLKSNWDEYEDHVAEFDAHLADFDEHLADFDAHLEDYETHKVDNTAHGLGNFLPKAIFSGWYNGSRSVTLQRGRGYIVVTSGHNAAISSLYLVGSTSTQQYVTPVLTGSSINVTIDSDMTLTITTSGTTSVAIIQFY